MLVSQKSPLLSSWGTLPSGDSMSAQTFYCYKNISQIVLGVPGVDWGISTCHQREDESSNLQNPHKKQADVVAPSNPKTQEAETGYPQDKLAS